MSRKKQNLNLLITGLFSVAYACVTFLLIIGPLHVNSTGAISDMRAQSFHALVFLVLALSLTWFVYTAFRKKPEFLFFTLMIMGIATIITEVMLFTA